MRYAGLSLAVFGAGLGLELWSQELKDDLVVTDPDTTPLPDKQEQYDRVSAASWIGVAAGLGLLATLARVAPRPNVPWWSWGLGVLGLGAAGGHLPGRYRRQLHAALGGARLPAH